VDAAIIGVLFVVILAWWERRRPHQASARLRNQIEDPRLLYGRWVQPRDRCASLWPSLTLPDDPTDVAACTRRSLRAGADFPRELPVVEFRRLEVGLRADVDDEERGRGT